MARERNTLCQPAKAGAEIGPVELGPEWELHQAYLVVPGTAAVACDDVEEYFMLLVSRNWEISIICLFVLVIIPIVFSGFASIMFRILEK